jgi:ribosome maturation factor RimP
MPKSFVPAEQLEALVAPVCKAQGVELVDVCHRLEQDGAVVRVLIELPGQEQLPPQQGVTLDDCTRVSRALSQLFDADDALIPGHYRLEVSSPGIERPLVKALDFERYAGREAQLSLRSPHEGRKNFTGTLLGLRDQQVLLREAKGSEVALALDEISKAHLVFRF